MIEKFCEFREYLSDEYHMAILSQASTLEEGATTIPEGSTLK
jgi:hypothetical protein